MSDVTVIIPARDRLWSLPKAVQSCRSSSINVQIIVIDDGSDDGTAEWLQSQSDIVTLQGDGWGKPWAIYRAWPMVSGSYVRFLDSDDWLNPDANVVQFHLGKKTRADIVGSGHDEYQDETFVRPVPWSPSDDFIAEVLGEGHVAPYSSFLFRTEFVKDIPHRTHFPAADFASRDDRCFLLEVALRNPRIAVSELNAFCHRMHNRARLQRHGGLRATGTHIQQLCIYRQILRLLDRRGELSLRRKRAAIKTLWPLAHWIGYHDIEEAVALANWIHELDPEFRPPDSGILGSMYRMLGFRQTEKILMLRRTMRGALGLKQGLWH